MQGITDALCAVPLQVVQVIPDPDGSNFSLATILMALHLFLADKPRNFLPDTKAGSSCPCRSAWYWCAPSPAASQCQSAPSKGSDAAPHETAGHAGTPSGSFGCCSSRRLSASPLMFPGFLPVSAPVPLCPSSF